MPDTKEDRAVQAMEDDVRRMAGNLRPTIANAPPPMPRTDDKVTVSHLHKALDQLTTAASQQADVAWGIARKLAGSEDQDGPAKVEGAQAEGPVFEGLARQVTDVGRQLARLKRAQEAIGRALS